MCHATCLQSVLHDIIAALFGTRSDSDYDDSLAIDAAMATKLLDKAAFFHQHIINYVEPLDPPTDYVLWDFLTKNIPNGYFNGIAAYRPHFDRPRRWIRV